MSRPPDVRLRPAGPDDAPAIAGLHADSWRRHYRGAYADSFLDGDVAADRLVVWTDRLGQGDPARVTIAAEDQGGMIGFAHTALGDDPTWGALLDNLHVVYERKGQGVGTVLMAAVARAVLDRAPASGLYLWVLEQNTAAQAFYGRRGGSPVERHLVPPPGGVPGRLNGSPMAIRYVWPEPAVLLPGIPGP